VASHSTNHSLLEYDIYGQVSFWLPWSVRVNKVTIARAGRIFGQFYLHGYLDVHIKQPQQLHVDVGLFVFSNLLFSVD